MSSLIDIKAFHFQPDGSVVQALANEVTSGETTESTEKLTQKFWILLMEQLGSVPYLPSQGSVFMNQFLTGQFSNDSDVFVNFTASLINIRPQLVNTETINDPPDEQYVGAAIQQIYILPDEINILAQINTQVGVGTTVMIPLQFLVR